MAPVADRTEGANIGSLTDGSVGRARRGHKKAGGEEGEEEKEEEEEEGGADREYSELGCGTNSFADKYNLMRLMIRSAP